MAWLTTKLNEENNRKVYTTLSQLASPEKVNYMLYQALRKAANKLRDDTREALIRKVPATANRNPDNPMTDGGRVVDDIISGGDRKEVIAYVKIYKAHKSAVDRNNMIPIWFEKGVPQKGGERMTKGNRVKNAKGEYVFERYLNSRGASRTRILRDRSTKHSTGSVAATNFFKETREADEQLMQDIISESIDRAIKDIIQHD